MNTSATNAAPTPPSDSLDLGLNACARCGVEISPYVNKCPSCGFQRHASGVAMEKRRTLRVAVAGAVASIVSVALIMLLLWFMTPGP